MENDDRYVFTDDGKSRHGVRTASGPASAAGDAQPKPPFSVLIVSEQKTLGREMFETATSDQAIGDRRASKSSNTCTANR